MQILQVVHQYPPEHTGGTEFYTHWLSRALSDHGHTVSVYCRRNVDDSGLQVHDQDGVTVFCASSGVKTPAQRFLATYGDTSIVDTFEKTLDSVDPDIVHIQHLMGLPAGIVDTIRQRSVPYVVTLHDYWWVCANAQLLTNYSQQRCDGPRAYLNCTRCVVARAGTPALWAAAPAITAALSVRARTLRHILEAADALITPTEFVRDWYAGHGVPAETLHVLPPGIDVERTLSSRQSRRPDDPRRFLYLGGLAEQKGVHIIIDAFQNVDAEAELWIAGDESFDPDYSASLHARAGGEVRFLGQLSRAEVWTTLGQVDVVLVPSLWYETFCFVIHEAFAAGVPVFASDLGALSERVRDGVDGLLLPVGDVSAWSAALQRAVDTPAFLERLRAGITTPPTFTQHVTHVEELYATVQELRRPTDSPERAHAHA